MTRDGDKLDSHTSGAPRLRLALTLGRKDLWYAHNYGLSAVFLNPLRDFVLDPVFAVSSILLPPLAKAFPVMEPPLYFMVHCSLYVLKFLYPPPSEQNTHRLARCYDLQRNANNDFVINLKAGLHLPKFRRPSNMASAFRGAVAFVVSSLADVVSVLLDRKKMKKWFQTLTEFKAYVDASGVGGELEEAVYKPLIRGRLLDNIKILNDIQEDMYTDRPEKCQTFTQKEIEQPLVEGKRMMRFATAAYGTEMIRSALDRDAHPHHLHDQMAAIAFHCNVEPDDIRIIYIKDGGDMHILRHFVVIDRHTKAVVLALRGTLSISGALVDMQAFDTEFCGGKAHKGMAEMADNTWKASGNAILQLFAQNAELKDFSFVIVGHSLGAGTACLLNVKCHVQCLLGKDRTVKCFGFAPPPTLYTEKGCHTSALIEQAIQNTVCYVHDNDCVPFLSILGVRRLAFLMDTIDNHTEHIWAYRRFRMFWEWDAIPQELGFNGVRVAEARREGTSLDGSPRLILPARLVVWMKRDIAGTYKGYGIDPDNLADLNIFCCQDMIADHLVEPYEEENALADEANISLRNKLDTKELSNL